MNSSLRPLRLALTLALATLATATFGAPPAASHAVTGVIREKLSDGSVLIAHDEIPGYMSAMTMSFDLADPREGNALKSGDRVRFRLRTADDQFLADRFVVLGQAAPPPVNRTAVSRLRTGDPLPALSLLDEREALLTRETLRGRFTLVTFIFTRCPVPEFCPAMAIKFNAVQTQIEREPRTAAGEPALRLLSITLDPEFDRPPLLAAYGEAVGAKPSIWNFATGTTEEITTLTRRFAVFTERNGVTLDHTLCTALIGPDATVREIWRGNTWSAEEILTLLRAQPDYPR